VIIAMMVKEIEIESIIIPKERARSSFTSEQEEELEASIRNHGFTVPILVSMNPDGTYSLIDGEHRISIAKKIGLTKIPAVIAEGDQRKLTILNILANTARGTQNPMDVSLMLKKASEQGASIDELAAATGHSVQWVQFYITLAELPEAYQEALRKGELKVGHIREAARLPNPLECNSALQSTLVHKWTVEELKYYVDRRLPELEKIYKEQMPEEIPKPPTPEEAMRIVNYGNCLACRRTVRREELRMPAICQSCYDFLMYFADQMHDTKQAMDVLYKAYNFYMDAIKQQKSIASPLASSSASYQEQIQMHQEQKENVKIASNEIDEETIKLAKKLKALKEAGIL
jgi:ParB family chromosome partitioning protein